MSTKVLLLWYKTNLYLNNMIKHVLTLLLLLQFCISIYAQIERKREFTNFNRGEELVRCFFQDDKGVIWVGTSYGLGMFDGQGVRRHKISDTDGDSKEISVYCSLKQDSTHYYLGTAKGLVLLDLETDQYKLLSSSDIAIRTIQRMNDSIILLGTLNGLIKYNTKKVTFQLVDKIPYSPVDPIVRLDSSCFLITNYHGLYLYDAVTETYESLPITSKSSSLILSIGVDTINQWAWIGTENGLCKYNITSGEFTNITSLPNAPIKNIHISTNDVLWLGTDNGLYIYDWKQERYEHIVHSSKNVNSLVNNIIWTVFEDKEHNIWLGTESGISVYHNSHIVDVYSWDNLVGSDEGNDIHCIHRDSRNNYWWGGSNGLGYYNPVKGKSIWFKMNQGRHSISHNRIRDIYEDWDKDLWVATDGGINRFDYATETFESYQIVDSTHTRNANWTYYISGDNHDNLYLVAYCGGVFVVNKKNLLSQKGKVYIADENYYHSGSNGLHSDFVQIGSMDKNGCLWVSSGGQYLDFIDFRKKEVRPFALLEEGRRLPVGEIKKMLHDKSGNLWLSMGTYLCKITADEHKAEIISNSIFHNNHIQLLEDAGEQLWMGTSDGIYVYDKTTGKFVYSGIGDSYFTLYYDAYSKKIWAGGIDQCLAFKGEELLEGEKNEGSLILSRLYVNDKPVYPHEVYDNHVITTQNVSSIKQLHLLHSQNNIGLDFLHTRYEGILRSRYVSKLEGVDSDWRDIGDLGTRISYSNLEAGDYVFELKELVHGDIKEDAAYFRLNIRIDNPWYWTYWAKGIYTLFACLLIVWVIKYFRDKNRFRIERIEKEKTLELSDLKMEFLTNMSHELKTPLSLIISPVSKLLADTKNVQTKELLSLIHGNALKLNSIVHQILTIKDWVGVQQKLYPSQLEFVTFIDSIVKSYQESMKNKNISITFHSDVDKCFVEVDISKIEAVVNNLLSNACKFSTDNGEVKVSLSLLQAESEGTQNICLKVIDNGIGIPANDLPHIFERFYQVSKNQPMNENGSGIGLSIVKDNVELHHGAIHVESEEGKGTSFYVTIPVIQIGKNVNENTSILLDKDESDCKVLIVEDNVDIAHFIMQNLRDIECLVAYNGKMGAEMALQYLPDIIIADIMMPVLNGMEMTKQLKMNIATSTIPIIILTAKDDKKTEYELLALGVEAFISKPFEMKELTIHIERILRNKYRLVRKLKEEEKILENKMMITESADEKFLKYITDVIEQNISNSDLNVAKLAELSGYNSKQIYRRVKQLTGYTTVDYIKGIRMKKAAMLLSQKQFMISEVMYMVGYSDSSYFSKCFVEKYGKTPKQYMESK